MTGVVAYLELHVFGTAVTAPSTRGVFEATSWSFCGEDLCRGSKTIIDLANSICWLLKTLMWLLGNSANGFNQDHISIFPYHSPKTLCHLCAYILICFWFWSCSVISFMQVGVYSKAVRMLELDLLMKRRYYMYMITFHIIYVNVRCHHSNFQSFAGARITGKRG